ncbi:PP2C family protein-serine/threonine phosphatase [Arthrobacter sp. TMN-37]
MTGPVEVPADAGQGLRVVCGYATHTGLRRDNNEDSLIAADPFYAVADGMGGHEAGEVASGLCVETLGMSPLAGTRLPRLAAEDLDELVQQADARIRQQTNGRAGTTLSGVVLVEAAGTPHWLFFNVGDSRTYRLSGGRFGQITIDHSEVQELVDTGQITEEQARTHPRRHVVTRALGTGDDAEPDFWLMPVEEGDRILVCSDGLSGELTDGEICDVLATIEDPQAAADTLIEATLRSGARDNVTVIVIDATGVPAAP